MNADKERYYQTQLLVERARYYQLLDEAYPDVGMGVGHSVNDEKPVNLIQN